MRKYKYVYHVVYVFRNYTGSIEITINYPMEKSLDNVLNYIKKYVKEEKVVIINYILKSKLAR